jgi:hypothetical protein
LRERRNIPVKSFRLSQEQIEMYNRVLDKLRLGGENESERFRNLIEFLDSYVDPEPQSTLRYIEGERTEDPSRLDLFDLVIGSLIEHEKRLDRIVTSIEKVNPVQVSLREP